MVDIRNRTGFVVGIAPSLDKDGFDHAAVIVKATFELGPSSGEARVAERQVPLAAGDLFHGEPACSSIRHESDYCPTKPGTDLVLVGHARAAQPVTGLDVSLSAGPLRKTVRIFGDRCWFRTAGGWAISDPLPFSSMPLRYERAFGGIDDSDPDPAHRGGEERNPVGTGYCVTERAERLEGLRLPNLEDPSALVARPTDTPPPAGFGFIGRHWLPRRRYAGTYDDAWLAERCPLLPLDFDERYFNAAPAELTAVGHFVGGEPVVVQGVRAEGALGFTIPKRRLLVATTIKAVRTEHVPVLDTVVIEPDELRLVLTYRVTVPCPQSLLYLDAVDVSEEKPA